MIPKRHLNINIWRKKIMILQRKSMLQKKRLKDSCRSKLETADIDVTNNLKEEVKSKFD
jgi:hypothetical protein